MDTTIEQRKREIGNISNDINEERDQVEQIKQNLRAGQVDLLTKRLEKAKLIYATTKNKTLSQRYDEVAKSKFNSLYNIKID